MKSKTQTSYRKLGANRNELAHNPRPRDNNFAQSRDLHEDRGERQIKSSHGGQALVHGHSLEHVTPQRPGIPKARI